MRPINEAYDAIRNSSPMSAVYLGCDSKRTKRNGRWIGRYATVIVVHRDGCHGAQLFGTIDEVEDYAKDARESIRMRMINEAGFAVQYGLDIIDAIGDRKFEIHLDIHPSPKHRSNVAIKEATGYVLGTFGFEPHVKPNAPAASYAADWIVNH